MTSGTTRIAMVVSVNFSVFYVRFLSTPRTILSIGQRRYDRITWSQTGPSLSIQIAIVKSAICQSAVKAGYCFDILRNESASTDQSSEHQGPWSAPHLVSVLALCLLLYLSLNQPFLSPHLHYQMNRGIKSLAFQLLLRHTQLYIYIYHYRSLAKE